MAEIVRVERKSDVLKRPALPCLSRFHTINLTAGCPYECRYCYARSFRSNPGKGKVLFYSNTLDLLSRQLPRKRAKPIMVYFSTACEPFTPHRQVLDCLHGVMELLLENDTSLLISTKSRIPETFLDLFVRHPGKVHVQMGLTTTNDRVRELLEPHAAGISDRLHTLRALMDRGVKAEVRSDPLIPELTDSKESFESLCRMISHHGTRSLAASYLFLRRGNYSAMNVEIEGWSFQEMAGRLYTDRIENYCGASSIRIPDRSYRRGKYAQMKDIAEEHGLKLHLCRCKTPDLITKCCHPRPPTNHGQGVQTDLFDS